MPELSLTDPMVRLILDAVEAANKTATSPLIPYEILGGAIAESALDPAAERHADWPDDSIGLLQEGLAWSNDGDRTNSEANWATMRKLYVRDPAHAVAVGMAKYRYWRTDPDVLPLAAWCGYNGGAGGYRSWFTSQNLGNYTNGLRQAAALLAVKPDVDGAAIDVTVPSSVYLQQNDWTCSVRSTATALYALASLGALPTVIPYDTVYGLMVPTLADASVGLHFADGHEVADLLRTSFGLTVEAVTGASLNRVQARAGKKILLLGFKSWGPAGHWVCCYGVDAAGLLKLWNPAGSYGGISNLLRDSFGTIGPCTMLAIDIPGATPPTPPPPADDPRIAALQAEVARLQAANAALTATRDSLVTGLAYVGDDVMDAIASAVASVRQVRTDRVGPRPV